MARSQRKQSAHNGEVRRIAGRLEDQGYKVQADIRGYPQPDTIGGYRPDVIGKKGQERKIHEVETPDSVDSARDQKQQRVFRRAADKSKHTTFKRTIADD